MAVLILFILVREHFKNPSPWNFPIGPHIYKGWLLENPQPGEGKTYLTLNLAKVLKPKETPLTGKIKLTLLGPPPALKKGDQVLFETSLKAPQSYRNPGGFDYQKFLEREGIHAVGFVEKTQDLTYLDSATPSWWGEKIQKLKNDIEGKIKPRASPQAAGVLKALLWGDENGLDEATQELFRNQGLSHLLVISGLHFTVVAGMLFFLILGVGKIFPPLFLHLPMRTVAAVLTLILLTAYYFFCEPGASITRAYLAISFVLLALLLQRSHDLLNLFFLCAFIILALNPRDFFNLSFQYSFIAVLSLLLILPWLRRIPVPWKENKIWVLVLINVSLFMGLTPLITLSFHEIQPNAFFMNLWAVPLLEGVMTPLGLLALGVFSLWPTGGAMVFVPVIWLTELTLWILKKAALYLPQPVLVYPPHGYELAVYYFLLWVLVLGFSKRFKKWASILALLFFALDLSVWIYARNFADTFTVTQIDVGQGDSLLLQTPRGHYFLIDGGGSPYFDVGSHVVLPFLLQERIPHLDAVVATHADTDHFLGLIPILQNYEVGAFWSNGVEVPGMEAFKPKVLKEGDQWEEGGARFFVFNPGILSDKDNNNSLVFSVEALGKKALFTGDIEWPVEWRLVEAYGLKLKSDYLKVPHHGSRTSSSELFLKAVSPQMASYGSRLGNRFGHPHREVVRRYQDLGISLFGTDQLGAVEVDLVTLRPKFPMK